MKKRFLAGVLLIMIASGLTFSQTIYDLYREKMLEETKARIKSSQSVLVYKAIDIDRMASAEIAKIKFKSIKFGGKIDFKGEKGTAIAFDTEYAWEQWKIFDTIAVSPLVAAVIKTNSETTSIEGTGGLRFDFPFLINFFSPFIKTGIGGKDPGGDKPSAFIFNAGPGITIPLGYNSKSFIEFELLYYLATKSIYLDVATPKKNDLAFNITIKFIFSKL